jgi:hypothetical protein
MSGVNLDSVIGDSMGKLANKILNYKEIEDRERLKQNEKEKRNQIIKKRNRNILFLTP